MNVMPEVKVEIEVKKKLLEAAMEKIEKRLNCRTQITSNDDSRNSICNRKFSFTANLNVVQAGWSYIKISKVDNLIERCNMYKRVG